MARIRYPKVDATAELYVNVMPSDVVCATPRDHCNCAVAQAVKRAIGCTLDEESVFIFPTVAYVLMACSKETARAAHNAGSGANAGQLALHRFMVDRELSTKILLFDETGDTDAVGGYCFRPPRGTMTMKAQRTRRTAKEYRGGVTGSRSKPSPWRRSSRLTITPSTPLGVGKR